MREYLSVLYYHGKYTVYREASEILSTRSEDLLQYFLRSWT